MILDKNIKIDEDTWKLLGKQRIDDNLKRIADVVKKNQLFYVKNRLGFKETPSNVPKNLDNSELREKLARLSHDSWMSWSKYLAKELIILCTMCKEEKTLDALKLIDSILQRWNVSWKDYSELDENNKDKDRILANKILEMIETRGKENEK